MDVVCKEVNNKKYIKLNGNLDGLSSNEVKDKILKEIKNDSEIVIDMENCPYVSSAGLRTLLTVGKSIKMKNGHMSIINLVDEVKDIMDITGFANIFKSFEG